MRLIRVIAGVAIITLTLTACGGQPPELITCPYGQMIASSGTHCNPVPGYLSAGPEPGPGASASPGTQFAIPVPQQ